MTIDLGTITPRDRKRRLQVSCLKVKTYIMDSAIIPTKRKPIRPPYFNKFIASFVKSTCLVASTQQFSTTFKPKC